MAERAVPARRRKASLALAAGLLAMAFATPEALAIVNKPFVEPITNEPAPGSPADVEADRITYDGKRKVATATGTVRIVYGPYTLLATRVVYDEVKDTFKANGSVELREPNGNVVQADSATVFNRFKEAFARHVKALLNNDVTITADYARRELDGMTTFERAAYTACKDCKTRLGKPLWEITTTKTIHDDPKDNLYLYNPTLRFGGVPVGWLPYVEMPDPGVKRRTGMLTPSLKRGDLYGFGLVTPYFITLGDSADLTLSPMWTTKQGPVADVEFRKATRNGQFYVQGYGVHQREEDPTSTQHPWRGAVVSRGDFWLGDGWSWGWDGTLTSDRTFLDNYDFDEREVATNRAYLQGIDDRSYFSAQALQFRSLNLYDSQERLPYALPFVDGETTLDQAVLGGELGFEWSVYSVHREDNDSFLYRYSTLQTGQDLDLGTDQTRAVVTARWQRQMISDIGTVFTPFARVRSDLYITDNVPVPGVANAEQDSDVTSRLLPSAGFDFRWPFIASTDFGQSVFTPVVQAVAATDETDTDKIGNEDAITVNFDSSSLFLQDRFTGLDRYEGGSRINAGVQYSFLADNGGFARLSAGESFHVAGKNSFDAESGLEGTKSDLVAAVTVQPSDWIGLNYQVRVEEDLSRINTQEGFANFLFGRFSGTLGYMNLHDEDLYGRDQPLEQVDAFVNYQFDDGWRLFGGLRYDLNNDKFLVKSAGIGFDCDCMNASLTYTEIEDSAGTNKERSLRFSIELRTLGATSFSSKL